MKDEEDGGREVVERHAERDCPLSLISSSFILHPSSFLRLHPFLSSLPYPFVRLTNVPDSIVLAGSVILRFFR